MATANSGFSPVIGNCGPIGAGIEGYATIRFTVGATGVVGAVMYKEGLANDSSFNPLITRNSAGNYTFTLSSGARKGLKGFIAGTVYVHGTLPGANDGIDAILLEDNTALASNTTVPTFVVGFYKRGSETAADVPSGIDVLIRYVLNTAQ
jgi:hypothetical protein